MASSYDPTDQSLPRGIRNNNPGNIKDDGTAWQGKTGSDGVFIIFSDMSWGTRAIARSLSNMIGKGNNTIAGIISAWAPASENLTQPYIDSVAADTGLDPGQVLTADPATLALLIRAIINHENGDNQSYQYVTDQDIQDGISKAGNSLVSLAQSAVVAVSNDPSMGIAVAAGLLLVGWLIASVVGKRKSQ